MTGNSKTNSGSNTRFPPNTSDKILGTLRNQLNAAGGSLLPPPQKGNYQVPPVTNLSVNQTTSFIGGTQFIVTFNEPENTVANIDHYNVYVSIPPSTTFQGPTTCSVSPATVVVNTTTAQRVVMTVQTVLKNGQVSSLANSPTCTGTTVPATVNSSNIPNNSLIYTQKIAPGTAGALAAFDSSGNPVLISDTATGRLLASGGTAAPPTYQTYASLGLVTGAGNLTTADSIVYVSSTGTVTQLSPSTANFVLQTNGPGVAPSWVANTGGGGSVQGAGNLTNVGDIPYVSAAGTLNESNNLYWDHTNGRLSIGGNTSPAYSLSVQGGDVALTTLGGRLRLAEGANASQGVSALTAGTVTVTNTSVTANSRILLTGQNAGSGIPGELYVSALTASTSFVITSTQITDNRNVLWIIFEPA